MMKALKVRRGQSIKTELVVVVMRRKTREQKRWWQGLNAWLVIIVTRRKTRE